jgi:hypothetical protein
MAGVTRHRSGLLRCRASVLLNHCFEGALMLLRGVVIASVLVSFAALPGCAGGEGEGEGEGEVEYEFELSEAAATVTDNGNDNLFRLNMNEGEPIPSNRFEVTVRIDGALNAMPFVQDAEDGSIERYEDVEVNEPGVSLIDAADAGTTYDVAITIADEDDASVVTTIFSGQWVAN